MGSSAKNGKRSRMTRAKIRKAKKAMEKEITRAEGRVKTRKKAGMAEILGTEEEAKAAEEARIEEEAKAAEEARIEEEVRIEKEARIAAIERADKESRARAKEIAIISEMAKAEEMAIAEEIIKRKGRTNKDLVNNKEDKIGDWMVCLDSVAMRMKMNTSLTIVECWEDVKGRVTKLMTKLSEEKQSEILARIDETINELKEQLYYEQVKDFTNDFKFLKEDPKIVRSLRGAIKFKKFTNMEEYERFYDLRSRLRKQIGYDEYRQIQRMLCNPNVVLDSISRKILMERKKVLEIEKEQRIKKEGLPGSR